jgi:hypothetical protein
LKKHLAPDTTACIFWLKNRRKDLWRERPEADQTLPYDPNESLEDIRDELLQDMAAAGLVRLLPPVPADAPVNRHPIRTPDRHPRGTRAGGAYVDLDFRERGPSANVFVTSRVAFDETFDNRAQGSIS